jgi:hypothetical protein
MLNLDLIFSQVSLKVHVNVANVTGSPLPSDCLKTELKIYVLHSVLEEFKTLCINVMYYTSRKHHSGYKVDRILHLIVILAKKKITRELHFLNTNISYSSSEAKWLLHNLETEDGELIKWVFEKLFLDINDLGLKEVNSDKLLISILETIVLKLTDILTYLLLLDVSSNRSILEDNINVDIVHINLQKNTVYWQSYVKSIFFKPKYIYSGVYIVHIFTSHGVCNKLVYLPTLRLREKKYLSTLQFTVLMYLEVLELVYPKGKWVINTTYSFFFVLFNKL